MPDHEIQIVWDRLERIPFVEYRISEKEQLEIPESIPAIVETADYRIELTTGLGPDLVPCVRELHVTPKRDDAPPMPTQVLRALHIGGIVDELVDRAAWKFTLTKSVEQPDGSVRNTWERDPASALDGVEDAHKWARRRGRHAEPGRLEADARTVADAYKRAVKSDDKQVRRAPIAAVAAELGMSTRTVQRRKDLAVELGLIEGDAR